MEGALCGKETPCKMLSTLRRFGKLLLPFRKIYREDTGMHTQKKWTETLMPRIYVDSVQNSSKFSFNSKFLSELSGKIYNDNN